MFDLLVIFILFAVAIGLIIYYLKSKDEEITYERILDDYEDTLEIKKEDRRDSFWRGASSLSNFGKLQSFLSKSTFARTITRYLNQLNLGLNIFEYIIFQFVLIFFAAGLSYLSWKRLDVSIGMFLIVPVVSWSILRLLALRQIDKIEFQLPGLLTQMLTTIRSGGTPANALKAAAENTAAPLGPSIRTLNETISLGVPPVKAWREWSKTWEGSRACDMLSTSIRLKWEAGGEMASVLEVLQEQLEARRRRELRIKALTAMARASTYVLIALPILMGFFTYKVNPRLFNEMINDPIGIRLLQIGAALIVVGYFWLRKIAKLED